MDVPIRQSDALHRTHADACSEERELKILLEERELLC